MALVFFLRALFLTSFALKLQPQHVKTSTWGWNADLFFSHLLALMYSNDVDSVYIYGDMNSCIADLKDYVDVDDSSPRVALDTGVNKL